MVDEDGGPDVALDTTFARGAPSAGLTGAVGAQRPGLANPWILSHWLDLLLFVAPPLLIIPLVAILQSYLSVPEISLYVLSFGAFGHHLPGMLRAYGDRELFARFRVRFIVAPLFLLAVCNFFAHHHLNGLSVVVLLWGTWHAAAQVFGFLRIYDAKISYRPLRGRYDEGPSKGPSVSQVPAPPVSSRLLPASGCNRG